MATRDDTSPTTRSTPRSTGAGRNRRDLRRGAALLAVGLWLLLGTLGGPAFDHDRSWPLLLVFLGLAFVMTPVGERGRRPGPLLIAAGALCWIAVHEVWGLGWHSIWPLILVAIGLSLVWSAVNEQRRASGRAAAGGDGRVGDRDG